MLSTLEAEHTPHCVIEYQTMAPIGFSFCAGKQKKANTHCTGQYKYTHKPKTKPLLTHGI